jgi:hypothetical protein
MKPTDRYIMFAVVALLLGFGSGGALEAQTSSEVTQEDRPALAAPIQVVGALTPNP